MSDCLYSKALDYIERLRRTNPAAAHWIDTGEWPAEVGEDAKRVEPVPARNGRMMGPTSGERDKRQGSSRSSPV